MNKKETLDLIKSQIEQGQISRKDLLEIASDKSGDSKHNSLINVLYFIGGVIAIIGVIIMIAQNWYEIGFIGRISVTLGLSLFTYILGFTLKDPEESMDVKKHRFLSQVMFLISAVLAPFGVYVLLSEFNVSFNSFNQFIVGLALMLIYGFAYFATRRGLLLLISLFNLSWSYYTIFIYLIDTLSYSVIDLIKFSVMLLGVAYLFIAFASDRFILQSERERKVIQEVVYGLGTLQILGACISFGGIFDLLLIAIIFGGFYLSVYVKSRLMLFFSAIFLVAHIIKLTGEYFASSIGWSLALIIVGFLIIGVGYMTFHLNRKYIS